MAVSWHTKCINLHLKRSLVISQPPPQFDFQYSSELSIEEDEQKKNIATLFDDSRTHTTIERENIGKSQNSINIFLAVSAETICFHPFPINTQQIYRRIICTSVTLYGRR